MNRTSTVSAAVKSFLVEPVTLLASSGGTKTSEAHSVPHRYLLLSIKKYIFFYL